MADLNLLKKFHIKFFFHLANLSVHCAAISSCLALSPKYKCAIPGTTGLSARSGTIRYRKKVVFVHSVLHLLFSTIRFTVNPCKPNRRTWIYKCLHQAIYEDFSYVYMFSSLYKINIFCKWTGGLLIRNCAILSSWATFRIESSPSVVSLHGIRVRPIPVWTPNPCFSWAWAWRRF